MLVKEAMTTPAVTVGHDASLSEAIALLVDRKLSGLPVVDRRGRICGIISEGDLLRRMELGTTVRPKHWWSSVFSNHSTAEAYRMAEGRKVRDVMSEAPVTIEETATLSVAADTMEKHRIKRIPVTQHGALVGMLTRADFVRMLRLFVAQAYEEPATSDEEIKHKFRSEMDRQQWAVDCTVRIEVGNGSVKLLGTVPSESHREAVRVAAENIIGVRDIDNELEILEPFVMPGF